MFFKAKKSQRKTPHQPKGPEQPKNSEHHRKEHQRELGHHRHHHNQHRDSVNSQGRNPMDTHKNNSSRGVPRLSRFGGGDERTEGNSVNINQNQQHEIDSNSEYCLLRSTEEDIVAYLTRMCGCDTVDHSHSEPRMCPHSKRVLYDQQSLRNEMMCSVNSLPVETAHGAQLSDLFLDYCSVKRCPSHVQHKLALEYCATRLSSTIAHCSVR